MSQYNTHMVLLFLFFILAHLLLSINILEADERNENIDVFLVVDKSLSMEEEIQAVKEYIDESIIDELLIPGDYLVIITFYGKAEIHVSEEVNRDRSSVQEKIDLVDADGRFTDIGNAFDILKEALSQRGEQDRRKYLLLITDGIQEAPPESKYYSADGSFNHEFLLNTKEILMEGWKVHILGIGTSTAAREIAKELAGTYSEVDEDPTKEELEEQTADLLGIVEQTEAVTISAVGSKGSATLSLRILSTGYEDARVIIIDEVRVSQADGSEQSVLKDSARIEIEPGEERSVRLPVSFASVAEPGAHDAIVTFSFAGDTTFSPASSRIIYRVKGFWGNNVWIIPAAALGVIAVALLVILIMRSLTQGESIRFGVDIGGRTAGKKTFKIQFADSLFVVEGSTGLNLDKAPGINPTAEIKADSLGLHLSILDKSAYKTLTDIPVDVLGKEITLVKKTGKKVPILFSRI